MVRLSRNSRGVKSFRRGRLHDSTVMETLVLCHVSQAMFWLMRFSPKSSPCCRWEFRRGSTSLRRPKPDHLACVRLRSRTSLPHLLPLRGTVAPVAGTNLERRSRWDVVRVNDCKIHISVDFGIALQVGDKGCLLAASCPAVDWHPLCDNPLRIPLHQ